MKNTVRILFIMLLTFMLAFSLAACGNTGDKGDKGDPGANGLSAYEIWINNGNTGSQSDFLNWLKGQPGTNGKDGVNGADGSNGIDGKSAYQIWLDNGNSGNETAFLEWLQGTKGTNGTNGKDGLSAYQIWLAEGNTGTEAVFLEWLKGTAGNNGKDGDKGDTGKSAFESFVYYNPSYPGDEARWINDLAFGQLLRFTVTFKSFGNEDIILYAWHGFDFVPPQVPDKAGNIGKWNITDFSSITENLTVSAVYETQNLLYTPIKGDTEYAVSRGTSTATEVFIPAYHNGNLVTTISINAFQSDVTSVFIPSSVTIIGTSAFENCASLESIIFADGSTLEVINPSAFSRCGITNIIIPKSVVSIHSGAFYGCANLVNVTFEAGSQLETIGGYVFSNSGISSIIIPASVMSIGDAFQYCPSLESVIIAEGSELGIILNGTFEDCSNLISVVIPASITQINSRAFKGCINLSIIYYGGTDAEWNTLLQFVDTDNDILTSIIPHYYSAVEPLIAGNFWQYVDNIPTVWTID